jgi:tol-pal system protein YbgF
MTRSSHRIAALAAFSLLLLAGTAAAQERNGNFLDNIFKRDQQPAQQQPQEAPPPPAASADSSELAVRIDRLENALRQMTGTIEQLQYQNQQLQMQLKRMQDDTEYRLQQLGSKAPPPAAGAAPRAMAPQLPVAPVAAPADTAQSGRRSDAFDPAQQPNAPGSPRTLGNASVAAPPADSAANVPPVGAPGGRDAGAPLDLTTLSGNPNPPPTMPVAPAAGQPVVSDQQPQRSAAPAAGVQLATLPPSASPKDEYELAYGYVLHKDYGLAEQTFRDFIRKYPDEKLQPDAQYWLGESQFQQQRYREAAESFLAVSTKYEKSGKAPAALLRLGQSLAALNHREAACATLTEVDRKYPRASASVKRGVAQELKRAHC